MTPTAPTSRQEAAALLLEVLVEACPAGEVCLIGSLATPGRADAFSDIDLTWTIPPEEAAEQLRSLRPTLRRCGEVESLRADPEPRPDSRLVFARFHGWPLWWRVDLEVHAPGVGSVGVPGADPWSPHESACMGVVVTLKALARDRPEEAEALWARALHRVDAGDVDGDWKTRVRALLDHLASSGPPMAALVPRTRRLSSEVLGE